MRGVRGLLRAPGAAAPLAFGVFNGLLPCPLVYAFIAQAVVAGSVGKGLATMVAFGLGTFPAMLLVGLVGCALDPDLADARRPSRRRGHPPLRPGHRRPRPLPHPADATDAADADARPPDGDRLTTVSGPPGTLCAHCLVPTGGNPVRGRVAGEEFAFCCFGCYLAFKVHGERGEEAVETLLLLRLGLGAFLAMNIMVLSLLLYTGAVGADQAGLRRAIEILLAVLATPAMVILGAPVARDAWRAARRRRVTAEAMIVLGAGAAYGYSLLSLARGEDRVYFDTAAMLLLLFTLGRYLDAAARARAARDLAPLLEAERATARVLTGAGRGGPPRRRGGGGRSGAGGTRRAAAGRRNRRRRVGRRSTKRCSPARRGRSPSGPATRWRPAP